MNFGPNMAASNVVIITFLFISFLFYLFNRVNSLFDVSLLVMHLVVKIQIESIWVVCHPLQYFSIGGNQHIGGVCLNAIECRHIVRPLSIQDV